MDLLGEIFLLIVSFFAELIGEKPLKSVDVNSGKKNTVRRTVLVVAVGVLSWAVIIVLGYAAYLLFELVHPVAGILVALVVLFLIVLFFSVIVKLRKNKNK